MEAEEYEDMEVRPTRADLQKLSDRTDNSEKKKKKRKKKSTLKYVDGQEEFTWKDAIPKGVYHKFYLILAIIEGLVIFALAVNSLQTSESTENIPDSYLSVAVMISAWWFLYFGIHGLYRHDASELIAFAFSLVMVEFYVIYRFFQVKSENPDVVEYVTPILITVLSLCFLFIFYKLFKTWNEWRFRKMLPILATDDHLRRLYMLFETCNTLLKLDALFGILMCMMGFFFYFTAYEVLISILEILIEFVVVTIGRIGIRLEKKRYIALFLFFCILQPIDYVANIVQFDGGFDQYENIPLLQILFTAIAALLVRFILIICTIFATIHFHEGLVDKVLDPIDDLEPAVTQIVEKNIKPYLTLTIKKLSSSTRNQLVELQQFPSSNASLP